MFTPKRKSSPSNLQLVSDEEVAISLERLIDSVVVEVTARRSALQLQQAEIQSDLAGLPPETVKTPLRKCEAGRFLVIGRKAKTWDASVIMVNESNDGTLDNYSRPDEVISEVFGYLKHDQLSQIAVFSNNLLQEKLLKIRVEVNESNDGTLDIDSLPDEVILEIFGYLKHDQLSRMAQVCSRWSVLVKRPILWKTVNVEFLPCGRSQNAVAKSFINKLPPCVTSIHLDFTAFGNRNRTLDYEKLCVILQEKCPDIKALILTNSVLLDSLPAVIEICSAFLQHVKNLTFHRCIFPDCSTRVEFRVTSKIEVLDVSLSILESFSKPQFSRMPCLKVLRLYCANACDFWFQDEISFLGQLHVLNLGYAEICASILPVVQNHGHNLKELYICGLNLENLEDYDLNFAHLEKICLSNTNVTCEGVVSLIQSCPSLQNVYVDEDVAETFAEHPFVFDNRCMSGIVKAICYIHKHN